MGVFGDEALSVLDRVSEERFKHFCRFLGIGGADGDEAAGCGTHGGLPHHIGLVLAKSLGALEGVFLALELFEYLRLFKFVICEEYLLLVLLALDRYLKEGDSAINTLFSLRRVGSRR